MSAHRRVAAGGGDQTERRVYCRLPPLAGDAVRTAAFVSSVERGPIRTRHAGPTLTMAACRRTGNSTANSDFYRFSSHATTIEIRWLLRISLSEQDPNQEEINNKIYFEHSEPRAVGEPSTTVA